MNGKPNMNNYWKISPCKDCTERHPACHDKCNDYISWKVEMLAEKEKAKQDKENRRADPWTRGDLLTKKKRG